MYRHQPRVELFAFFITTLMRVKSARIFLFSIARMCVKSTRNAAHKSYLRIESTRKFELCNEI
jgi:hypothetical protein